MSYFVTRRGPHRFRGHWQVKRELTVVFEKEATREAVKRQVNGGGATDILLTVCHKDNSSKRNYYHLVFT